MTPDALTTLTPSHPVPPRPNGVAMSVAPRPQSGALEEGAPRDGVRTADRDGLLSRPRPGTGSLMANRPHVVAGPGGFGHLCWCRRDDDHYDPELWAEREREAAERRREESR